MRRDEGRAEHSQSPLLPLDSRLDSSWIVTGGADHGRLRGPLSFRRAASRRGPSPIACNPPEPVVPGGPLDSKPSPSRPTEPAPFRFVDILPGSGVDFVHVSGMTAAKQFPTANGSGVAIFDFDNDGRMDLYFATGNTLPLDPARAVPNRLYKNLGGGRFLDVTERSGLGFRGYCHGAIVGDIDNDGDQDVFLCNYGGDALFLNNGDGTFTDISRCSRRDPARHLVFERRLSRLR